MGQGAPRLPSVFRYRDYRAFLRDYFAAQKRLNPRFSYRSFALRTGLGYHAHLQRVLNGTGDLSPALVARYAKALRLTPGEADYLAALVSAGPAGVRVVRRRESTERILETILVHHLLERKDARTDPAWVARMTGGIVGEDRAREILADRKKRRRAKGPKGGVAYFRGDPAAKPDPVRRLHAFCRALFEGADEPKSDSWTMVYATPEQARDLFEEIKIRVRQKSLEWRREGDARKKDGQEHYSFYLSLCRPFRTPSAGA